MRFAYSTDIGNVSLICCDGMTPQFARMLTIGPARKAERLQPLGEAVLLLLIRKPLIAQDDGSVIVSVPNDTTNSLVDSSCGLLDVPLVPSQFLQQSRRSDALYR